jgi:hypothetical protein
MKSSGEAGVLPSAEYKRIYTIGSEPSAKRADALLSEKALNRRRADALPLTSGLARQMYVVRCPGGRTGISRGVCCSQLSREQYIVYKITFSVMDHRELERKSLTADNAAILEFSTSVINR